MNKYLNLLQHKQKLKTFNKVDVDGNCQIQLKKYYRTKEFIKKYENS